MIPVLIGITIIVFTLVHMAPGDPFSSLIDPNITQADRENMLRAIGYYDPLPLQYIKWVGRALHGDLGYSIAYKAPVIGIIGRRMVNTLLLSVTALVIGTFIAVPLGVISATKKNTIFDYVVTVFAFIGLSIPVFFLALLLVKFLAFNLKLFPISGMQNVGAGYTGFQMILDLIHHMALPIIVLSLNHVASLMRYTRSAMLEVIGQDYIRTAKAKGVKERVVIYRHALRNALIPVVTIVSLSLGYLISGAVLTETVFVWPGMGTLVYQAILNRDYNLVIASLLIISIFILAANLLADILYAVVDPRIKYD